jgi:hypothetical protein
MKKQIRQFSTGATRNLSDHKFDYEGFNSPFVEHRFAQYMHTHRKQKDGTLRESDNWQKGLPEKETLKSLIRHTYDLWLLARGGTPRDPDTGMLCDKEDLLCAIRFNTNSLLHETLKAKISDESIETTMGIDLMSGNCTTFTTDSYNKRATKMKKTALKGIKLSDF